MLCLWGNVASTVIAVNVCISRDIVISLVEIRAISSILSGVVVIYVQV